MSQSQPPLWRVKKNRAQTRWGDLSLEVDVQQPSAGVVLGFPGSTSNLHLLATPRVLVAPQEKLDPFTRAGHLITAYPCSDQRVFGGELSYRVSEYHHAPLESNAALNSLDPDMPDELETIPALTIELIYSIQTDLLDTQPRPVVVSQLTGEAIEFFHRVGDELQPDNSSEQAVACLIRNGKKLTLITVMPSDRGSCSLNRRALDPHTTEFELSWELVADFLEKGVIRRFRAFSAIGSDRDALFAAAESFYHSDVPLTA